MGYCYDTHKRDILKCAIHRMPALIEMVLANDASDES